MDYKYFLKILIIVFLILSLIIFVNSIGLNFNEYRPNKKLLQVVTIEGQNNQLALNKSVAFCQSHSNSSATLNDSCGKLTRNNCNSTSCCVWTSDKNCLAGNVDGPTFNTDKNGKTKPLDYYYFQNKCYGKQCG